MSEANAPVPGSTGHAVVEMRGIVKRFPGVVANAGVDFDLLPGEVHALLGENGAGKTTLMNVLYGLYPPDAGEVRVLGERVAFNSAADAIAAAWGWCISTSCWSSHSLWLRISYWASAHRANR